MVDVKFTQDLLLRMNKIRKDTFFFDFIRETVEYYVCLKERKESELENGNGKRKN